MCVPARVRARARFHKMNMCVQIIKNAWFLFVCLFVLSRSLFGGDTDLLITVSVLDNSSGVVDGFCFNVKYELPSSRSDYSDDYLVRIRE